MASSFALVRQEVGKMKKVVGEYFGFVHQVLFALRHPRGTRDTFVTVIDQSTNQGDAFAHAWERSFRDDGMRREFDEFKSLSVQEQRARAGIKRGSK